MTARLRKKHRHEHEEHLLINGNLLQVSEGGLGEIGLLGTNGCRSTHCQVVKEAAAKGAIGVKLALQALHVRQKVDNVHVCVSLLGGNTNCTRAQYVGKGQ